METNKISVNVWDDYYDDGYVPKGKIQETYAYVECKISDEDCKNVLELLKEQFSILSKCGLELNYYDSAKVYPNLVGTEYEYSLYKRWQLEIKNLTHEERENIVKNLRNKLQYQGTPILVYSES